MSDHLEPLRELVREWRGTIRQGQDSGGNWYDPVEQEISGCADDLARVIEEMEGRVTSAGPYHPRPMPPEQIPTVTIKLPHFLDPGAHDVLFVRRKEA